MKSVRTFCHTEQIHPLRVTWVNIILFVSFAKKRFDESHCEADAHCSAEIET